jgi:hypothetical protein
MSGLAQYRSHQSSRPVPIKAAGPSVIHKYNDFVTLIVKSGTYRLAADRIAPQYPLAFNGEGVSRLVVLRFFFIAMLDWQ